MIEICENDDGYRLKASTELFKAAAENSGIGFRVIYVEIAPDLKHLFEHLILFAVR